MSARDGGQETQREARRALLSLSSPPDEGRASHVYSLPAGLRLSHKYLLFKTAQRLSSVLPRQKRVSDSENMNTVRAQEGQGRLSFTQSRVPPCSGSTGSLTPLDAKPFLPHVALMGTCTSQSFASQMGICIICITCLGALRSQTQYKHIPTMTIHLFGPQHLACGS